MSPWERHCFKDGSYDRYQSTTIVAPWPAAIAPKFKALGKAREFPLASLRFPPYLPWKDGRLSWPWQTWPPNHSTEVSNLPPACMACMCVPPSWLVATSWLVPILLKPLVKVRGSSPQRGSSPLLIVPTPEGWKAEYTLASRMQIHDSLSSCTSHQRWGSNQRPMDLQSDALPPELSDHIHTYIVNLSELLCLIPILVGSSVATVCPSERDTALRTAVTTVTRVPL